MNNVPFYVLNFFKKGDTIQGGTLLKGGHYLRKYGIRRGPENFAKSYIVQSEPLSKETTILNWIDDCLEESFLQTLFWHFEKKSNLLNFLLFPVESASYCIIFHRKNESSTTNVLHKSLNPLFTDEFFVRRISVVS